MFLGYLFGAALMIGAAIVELAIGVKAERRSLEDVARPISSVEPAGMDSELRAPVS